jgi:hypothetical protein
MKKYGDFHDGFLDGLWVDGSIAHVYLRTLENEASTLVGTDVAALTLTDFKQGNIIFDVIVRGSDEICLDDIRWLYLLPEGEVGENQALELLAKAHDERLSVLEITPSYGAVCMILARSFDLMTRQLWLERYLMNDATNKR